MIVEYLQRLAWDRPRRACRVAGWVVGRPAPLLYSGVWHPPGVMLGHHGGLGPIVMSILYFASDVVLACVFEPMLLLLAHWRAACRSCARGHRVLAQSRGRYRRTHVAPIGIALTAFGAGLPFGRALAAAAGFGLVSSWLFTIAGDMAYFGLGMASTSGSTISSATRDGSVRRLAVMIVVRG